MGAPLPTPDSTGTVAMSASAGKLLVYTGSSALVANCPTLGSTVIDIVGYGSSANCFEGSGPTPSPSATTAVFRQLQGCQDSDNNASDFATAVVAPRNSATPVNVCP